MNIESQELYEETKKYFMKRIASMRDLEANTANIDDCCDAVYAIRESVEYLEKLRKTLEKFSEELQQAVCLNLLTRGKKSHSTAHCCAIKRSSISYPVPTKRKEPEEYVKLMTELGIPADVIRRELVRVHWPSFKEYCTELASKGLNPPIDPTKGSPHFGLTIRRKLDVLTDPKDEI